MNGKEIKIQLLNKIIPIKVISDEQEQELLEVSKLIDKKIKAYKDKYKIADDVILMIMLNLEVTSELIKLQNEYHSLEEYIGNELDTLDNKLQSAVDSLES